MLMLSQINPFDSTEAKPYKNDPEIMAMTNLVSAYERSDIKTFEKILKDNQKSILEDSFIKDYIGDLLKNIRTQVMLKILTPYTKIRIPFLSSVHLFPLPTHFIGIEHHCERSGRLDGRSHLG